MSFLCCPRRAPSPIELEMPILPLPDYKIKEAWEELERKTRLVSQARWGTEQALRYSRPEVNIHRWAEERAKLRIGSEDWAKVSWLQKGIITSEYPLPDFSDLLQKIQFAVVDLTRPGEMPHFTPRSYGGLEVAQQFFYSYTQGSAKGWHCHVWDDGTVINPRVLNQMVQDLKNEVLIHKIHGLWVHCRAGVGRTGIFVSAILLKERIEKKLTTEKTLLEDVTDLVFKLRISQQLTSLVYNFDLFSGIVRYGEYLILKEEI